MNNRLYIACAGSGKTSLILEQAYDLIDRGILDEKEVAIITYTSRNQDNIKGRIIEKYGFIPSKLVVKGWYSFLLDYMIRPFKGTVIEELFDRHVSLAFVSSGQSGFMNINGSSFYTYHNDTEKFLNSKRNAIFSDKIAEFAFRCYKNNAEFFISRIGNIFDTIFIDEAQDLVAWDLELIKILLKKINCKVVICADPRQNTYDTSGSRKNSDYKGRIDKYLNEKVNTTKKNYVEVDSTTLNCSHRSVKEICEFASRVEPEYPGMLPCHCIECENKRGAYNCLKGMFLVKQSDEMSFIRKYNPISLIYSTKSKSLVKTSMYYNYGESKGLEFDSCIIHPISTIIQKFLATGVNHLAYKTKCLLYVALTRARYACAIVVEDNFDNQKIGLPFWKTDS